MDRGKKVLKSSRIVQRLITDRHNAGLFTNLQTHELMLADSVRVQTYRDAFRRQIAGGSVVLDLGTGTGLLSLLCAAQQPKKIYALDHSDLIEVAQTIAAANGVDIIEFVRANSRTFTPPEKVDVIIHEQLGTGLFDENMLTNLLDLKKRVLKRGGTILPGRFELFMEPVTLKPDYVFPPIADIRIEGVDLSCLRDLPALERYRLSDYRLNPHDARMAVSRFIGEPKPYLAFDLNVIDSESDIQKTVDVERRATTDGPLDAYCFYFRVVFDDQVAFDTSPLSRYTHWGNRLYRADSSQCRSGDTLAYRVEMNPLTDARFWRVGPIEVG